VPCERKARPGGNLPLFGDAMSDPTLLLPSRLQEMRVWASEQGPDVRIRVIALCDALEDCGKVACEAAKAVREAQALVDEAVKAVREVQALVAGLAGLRGEAALLSNIARRMGEV